MQGLIKTKNGTYIFRDDIAADHKYFAWNIYDDYSRGMTHKWNKLPNGYIDIFNVDNPPKTISFIPIIS